MKSAFAATLLLMATCCTACKRRESAPFQQGWSRVANEPSLDATILRQATESPCIWQTNQKQGRVTVSRQGSFHQRPEVIREDTPNGTLIGTNRGEWGGNLTLSTGKEDPPNKLLDGDVLEIIPTGAGFLIVTGNLPLNEGKLWLYSSSANHQWAIEKKADLLGYPLAALKTKIGIWLASGNSIYLLDDKFGIQNLVEIPWLQLHPNSIAADNSGALYVGMQAFVVRLTPSRTGYTKEWFAGDGCLL